MVREQCPYSEGELQKANVMAGAVGELCCGCLQYDCEYNCNPDNPEIIKPEQLGEYAGLFAE